MEKIGIGVNYSWLHICLVNMYNANTHNIIFKFIMILQKFVISKLYIICIYI